MFLWLYDKGEKMNEIISLEAYLMGRQKLYPLEYTPELQQNAIKLLKQVNALLNELGIKSAKVSSGWRPAAINSQTPNAAKRSAHMICLAVDILDDKNQTLAKLVGSRPDLLKKYSLWMEDSNATIGINTNWCHLDLMSRQDRPSRTFKP